MYETRWTLCERLWGCPIQEEADFEDRTQQTMAMHLFSIAAFAMLPAFAVIKDRRCGGPFAKGFAGGQVWTHLCCKITHAITHPAITFC